MPSMTELSTTKQSGSHESRTVKIVL